MFSRIALRSPGILAVLAVLMAATRFHHTGTPWALPDASLAVFFLGGFYSGGLLPFAGLLIEAGLVDYWAIAHAGVSDYCVTPAYGFLIPTYAAMWWAGQWSARMPVAGLLGLSRIAAALLVSTMLAFLISNGSFFVFSGRLAGADGLDYSLGVARDFPTYLGAALAYSGLVMGLVSLARFRPVLLARERLMP
jgi:hypothetical protein